MIGARIKHRLGDFGRRSRLSEVVHRLDQVWYKTPSPFFRPVDLDEEGRQLLASLRERGVAVVPDRFTELAHYVRKAYLAPLDEIHKAYPAPAVSGDQVPHVHQIFLNPTRPTWVERPYVAQLSFLDPELRRLFFDPLLTGVMTNYFRRQVYHRNYPLIVKTEHTGTAPANPQGKFHVDGGLGQISTMFLLNDLTEEQTHMQYAVGSHKQHVPYRHIYNRWAYPDDAIAENHELFPLIGPAGTLFLFDAAHGFHRAVYRKDTVRNILHMNFSTGAFVPPERFDPLEAFAFLRDRPRHMRRMMDRIAGRERP